MLHRILPILGLVWITLAGCDAPKAPPPKQVAAPAQPAQPAEMVREQAKVGMTGKGQGYGGDPITEPVKQLWRVQEQVVLLQIDKALQLFEATENRKPNSHDEFMTKIIQENAIKLPQLPAGHKYVYDPAKAELQVERPR